MRSLDAACLAEVCQQWETACEPAMDREVRVANLRFGVVLSSAAAPSTRCSRPFVSGSAAAWGAAVKS